ncbi:MBL fold metallo-hydrolase [Roseomonas arctica]|uniref:MBL fold metallo-hydrolase n=1 Tax=Plastoroseomonas arctica TaxID=1509237 RepID=A0AAF1JUL5_9PROT|nr:MBL fold metallo-hydrolase [Plastoroseomonas arctica]
MPADVPLRVTLLGTGASAGVPQIGPIWGACDPTDPRNRRTRSAILVEGPDGRRLLVDAGPDLRAQLLAACVGRIDALMFTHHHADHIMGVDELRVINRAIGRELEAHALPATLDALRRRFDYAFLPPTPPFFFRPALVGVPVQPGETAHLAGLAVRFLSQDHGVMETLGIRIGDFAYSTDLVRMPEATLAALHGLDTWVVACFQREPHRVHASLGQVLKWVTELRPRRVILTHMGIDLDAGWMAANLPAGVEAGLDGMTLEVG